MNKLGLFYLATTMAILIQLSYAGKVTKLITTPETIESSTGIPAGATPIRAEPRSTYNTFLEAVEANSKLEIEPISFIISRVDMLNDDAMVQTSRNSNLTIPIIVPAGAQLAEPQEKILVKRKKNFSRLAKTIMLATRKWRKKNNVSASDDDEDLMKTTEIITTTTLTTPFDLDSYCIYKDDGMHADPTDCTSFIICFEGKPFKTSCAAGTMWNHVNKDCDYASKVDCHRMPPTTTTTTTTTTSTTTTTTPTTSTTTTTRNPRISYFLLPRLTTRAKIVKSSKKNNLKQDSQSTSSSSSLMATIKTNIVLATIIIPSTILVIVVLGTTLWYFGRRSSNYEQRRLEQMMRKNKGKVSHVGSYHHQHRHHHNHHQAMSSMSDLDCCYHSDKLTPGVASTHSAFTQFNPMSRIYRKLNTFSYKVKSKGAPRDQVDTESEVTTNECCQAKYTSIIFPCSASNVGCSSQVKSNRREIPAIVLPAHATQEINQKSHHGVTAPHHLNPRQEDQNNCSRSTFESHFEDNNWDYNFATRGLYFSQPWARPGGGYTHTMGSESMPNSGVLTLDPTIDLNDNLENAGADHAVQTTSRKSSFKESMIVRVKRHGKSTSNGTIVVPDDKTNLNSVSSNCVAGKNHDDSEETFYT